LDSGWGSGSTVDGALRSKLTVTASHGQDEGGKGDGECELHGDGCVMKKRAVSSLEIMFVRISQDALL
jgi:hypothetical protein